MWLRYYALAEEARFYSNGGPCCERLASRLADYIGDVSLHSRGQLHASG